MKKNIHNTHAFETIKKEVLKTCKELKEELNSYEKWYKTSGDSFDAYQPHFYYLSMMNIYKNFINAISRIDNYVNEVFSASLNDLPFEVDKTSK